MKTLFSTLRVILLVMFLMGLSANMITASAVTQSEIDALEAKRDEIRHNQANMTEQIDALKSDRDSVMERKAAMDSQSELLRQDIVLLNEQIELYDQIILEKKEAVETAKSEEEKQYSRYCQRVRAMEENGNWSYISFILKADSLADLLSRWNDVFDILSHDQNVRAEYIAAREAAEAVEIEYEQAQEQQEAKRTELTVQETQLNEQIEATGRLITQLEDDIDSYMEYYEAAEAEKAEVQALIDQKAAELLRQQQEEEAARARAAAAKAAADQSSAAKTSGGGSTSSSQSTAVTENNNGSSTQTSATQTSSSAVQSSTSIGSNNSGYYSWPSYCTYITSPYGWRIHPISGENKLHSGADIAASYGTTITAAASGTVSIAQLGTTGYGNYVAIYHSNGTTTLYGHMSSLAVSQGETVTQGQVIGYVGSSGVATGPHLHFEIRVNGACVDPLPYFSNISFTYG